MLRRMPRLLTKKFRLPISLSVFVSLFILFYVFTMRYDSQSIYVGPMIGNGMCQIPDLHPDDPRMIPFIQHYGAPRCKHQAEFIQASLNGSITLSENVFKYEQVDLENVSCFYQGIYRLNNSDEEFFQTPAKKFSKKVQVPADIAHVGCRSTSHTPSMFYENFLPLYHMKKDVVTRRGHEKPNILFVGSDSLSRLNSMRHLKQSYEYLEKTLKAHIFRLHVKCDTNTRPNMMALLTGKRMTEYQSSGFLFPGELNDTHHSIEDDWPFIWKDFAKVGYASAIAEYDPFVSMFNYNVNYYRTVDHYMRDFFIAWKNLKEKGPKTKKSNAQCVMNTPTYSVQYQWILNIMRMYKNNPVFGLAFDCFTHNHIKEFIPIDKPLRDLLESLHTEQLLNNTILFVIGDHGVRYGSYRETWMGRLEDNTPLFSIVLPQWIKDKYSHLDEVLSHNEDKLTTWYDIHATLRAILQSDYGDFEEPDLPRIERGLSLFRKISSNRTCQDAGIPLQFCPCNKEEKLPVTESSVQEIGRNLVEVINDKVKHYGKKCRVLKLKYVKEATAILVKDDQQPLNGNNLFNVDLRLIIQTSPNGGLFETTMFYDKRKKKYFPNQSIERLDGYHGQDYCVEERELKRFCFCV